MKYILFWMAKPIADVLLLIVLLVCLYGTVELFKVTGVFIVSDNAVMKEQA